MFILSAVVSKQFTTVTSKHVYSVGPAVGNENSFNSNEVCDSRNNSEHYDRVCAPVCILITVHTCSLPCILYNRFISRSNSSAGS